MAQNKYRPPRGRLYLQLGMMNVSILRFGGALGVDNGRYGAVHLGVTASALPRLGGYHGRVPSAPQQPTPCTGLVPALCTGADVRVPAGSQWLFSGRRAQPSARAGWLRGTLTSCRAHTPRERPACYPCHGWGIAFKKRGIPGHKSGCWKAGSGFPCVPPGPAELH